jgi:hypothetical protein
VANEIVVFSPPDDAALSSTAFDFAIQLRRK